MMKKITTLLLLLLTVSAVASSQYPIDSVLNQIDNLIVNHEVYSKKREARISVLMKKLNKQVSINQYNLNLSLFKEYKTYICDSAISYLNKSIKIAQQLGNQHCEYEGKIKLALLMGSTGMYKESVDIMNEINRNLLPNDLVSDYYQAHLQSYGELAYYTQDKVIAERYKIITSNYRDSLRASLPPDSEMSLIMKETRARNTGKIAEAFKINNYRMSRTKSGTPEYALVTYHRSTLYEKEGNVEGRKYYLALSAISDIQSATKDHASLWMLAKMLYNEDDISRSYNYMRFSWNETIFFNARLRQLQSALILSLIDKTYQATIENQKQKLQNYLILISTLSILLVFALVFIYRQMKRLSTARKNLQVVNDQLKELNEELKQLNNCLQSTNLELSESNQIKEVYIGRFIKLCSTYIDKLDEFRRMVNKKIDSGKTAELLKYTRSHDALDEVFQELYSNFDSAFLRIFPDFVEKVNALLQDEEKISLKVTELLNTELRILALVRLGIQDSSQIADFLRYSVNTIYNYRAKVKNRAISRDDFEDAIMLIK